MTQSEDKIVQYLFEARAGELALQSTLRAHLAMTPSSTYRKLLETHLEETKDHARRLQARLGELGGSRNTMRAGVGLAQGVMGQALALGKGPLDLVRGHSAEEKLLKNCRDECAAEALEIASYDILESLARLVGDEPTAALAVVIRAEEERMLGRLREELPRIAEAMARAELAGDAALQPAAARSGSEAPTEE